MDTFQHHAWPHPRWMGKLALLLLATTAALALMATDVHAQADALPLTVTSPEDWLLTNSTTLTVAGTTAPAARVSVTVERSPSKVWNYEAYANIEGRFAVPVGLYEGPNRIHVEALDGRGNTNEAWVNVTVDTLPPQVTLMQPGDFPVHTNLPTYTIFMHVTGADDYAVHPWVYPYYQTEDVHYVSPWSLEVELDETPGIHVITVNLTEGENVVDIVVRDKVGNAASLRVVIIADYTPPELNVDAPASPKVLTNSPYLTFKGNVTGAVSVVLDSGSSRRETVIAQGDYVALWAFMASLGPNDGSWFYTVRAVDAVGNEASWMCEVTLDATPPALDIWPPLGNVSGDRYLVISGTTGSGVEMVLVNDLPYPVVQGKIRIVCDLDEGENHIVIEAWDAAGNVAAISQQVMCDDGPPDLRLFVPRGSDGPHVHVRGTTDANVETVQVEGVPCVVVNGSFDAVVRLVKGRNRITVEVVDPAGNMRSEEVEVRYGATWPEVGLVAAVVAGTVAARWAMLGWRDRRGERKAMPGNAPG